MKTKLRSALALAAIAVATTAGAQITFYEHEDFRGRSFTTERQIGNFERWGFNDRASSVQVERGRWEVCDDLRFNGRCVILRRGGYPTLASMGLNDQISSVRRVESGARLDDDRYPRPSYSYGDFRRRTGEQLYEADVVAVRAVVAQPEQRCWVDRDAIPHDRREANVPGALAGGVIGGILGHQIGGGSGRDAATVAGAIAGLALGANAGRDAYGHSLAQDVRRCNYVRSDVRPDYWDVAYRFRGEVHHAQMTRPPGNTVLVNEHGEPRVG